MASIIFFGFLLGQVHGATNVNSECERLYY